MEATFLSPPAKRPYHKTTMPDTNSNNSNGANNNNKRRSNHRPPSVPTGHTSLRLLCHVTKIGGVIGKSGSVIKLFRQETGAKIRIEEPVSACDERVILVVAPDNPKKVISVKGEDGGGGGNLEVSPAQDAFLRVFERVLDVEAETEGIFPPVGGAVSCRMLAERSQVGAVIGKGGKVVDKIRRESGTKIRVLTDDQVPACASPSDEVIHIMGDIMAVKKALIAVSNLLQENPPSDKGQIVGSRHVAIDPYGSFSDKGQIVGSRLAAADPYGNFPDAQLEVPHRSSFLSRSIGNPVDYGLRGRTLPTEVDRIPTQDTTKQQEVAFRLVCANDNVGGVIGKGGSIVKALQAETGANISVASAVSDAEDRVITVSATESPDSRFSPAQTALVRVFTRAVDAALEKGLDAGSKKDSSVSARLLIQANQVGCLMGKGGTIISEMRKVTGTGIRIIAGDKVPKWVSENDNVVQIVGEFSNVQDALFHVTGRLRDNLFPSKMPKSTGAGTYSSSTFPEISSYGRVREPTSPGLYPPVGISRSFDRQTTLAHSMDHLGLSHSLDRPPSPQPWISQPVGGIKSRNIDTGRGLTTLRGGLDFGSGGKTAIVTNTTVEILVPEALIVAVYGENGGNLNRLRHISGAKVVMHEPRPGTTESTVIISGTPDQTQAAQSLLQAFILSGQSSPDHRSRLL